MANTKMKILVVDDFATMWKIMRKLLKQLDFTNVEDADDGATAIEKLKADNYDFVITDLNMPQITRLELLKSIRADKKMKEIPLLMVTAESPNLTSQT